MSEANRFSATWIFWTGFIVGLAVGVLGASMLIIIIMGN